MRESVNTLVLEWTWNSALFDQQINYRIIGFIFAYLILFQRIDILV